MKNKMITTKQLIKEVYSGKRIVARTTDNGKLQAYEFGPEYDERMDVEKLDDSFPDKNFSFSMLEYDENKTQEENLEDRIETLDQNPDQEYVGEFLFYFKYHAWEVIEEEQFEVNKEGNSVQMIGKDALHTVVRG